MNLSRQAHLQKIVGATAATSVGILIVATIVINNFVPSLPGNVLSQTTSNATDKTARNANYTLTVIDVTRSQPDSISGNKHATVKLTFQNLSDTTLQISPGLQMFLRTDSGQQYNMTAKYLTPGLVIGGPLVPGAISGLALDFDIPDSATPVAFVYQPDAGTPPSIIKL